MISAPGLAPGMGMDADWFAARLRATQSFAFFVRHVLGNTCVDSRYGFHRDLCAWFSRPRSRRKAVSLTLAPRGFLKSTIGTVDHSVWSLLVDPDERIMIMHGIEDKALSYLDEIVSIAQKNRGLRAMAPEIFKKIRVKDGTLTVTRPHDDKVPSISCYGMGSATAGHHYTLYKLDDLVNDSNYQTKAGIEEPKRKFLDVMSTRRGRRSRVDVIDTVYANDDLTQWLQHADSGWSDKIETWRRSCWYTGPRPDGNGNFAEGEESWWPEERPVDFIDEQRGIGPIKFAQQYLCEPATEGARLFKPEWVRRYAPHLSEGLIVLPGEDEDDGRPPRTWRRRMALDGVYGEGRVGKDRACALVYAMSDEGDVYLLDVYYDRPDDAGWYDEVHGLYCKWRPERMKMEQVGGNVALWNALEQDGKRRGVRYPLEQSRRRTGGRGYDAKTQRFEALQAFVSAGRLYVPEGAKWEKPLAEMWSYQHGIKNQLDDFLDTVYDAFDDDKPPPPSAVSRAESAWGRAAAPNGRRRTERPIARPRGVALRCRR